MLRMLHFIFATLGIAFAAYGLITQNYQFQNFMVLFLGLTFLVMSITEFKEGKRIYGSLLVATALFAFFMAVQGFLLT